MSTSNQMPPEPKSAKRRLLSLSVRSMMVVVLVLAVVLGWFVRRAHIQRDAAAAIEKTGGRVVYEWQKSPAGTKAALNPKAEPKWPKWLVKSLGVDYFGDVELVTLGDQSTDDVMAHLGRLPRLEGLSIAGQSGVTDAGVVHLRGLAELNHIGLSGSKVTGACLANFRGMTKLDSLHLVGVPVTDDDLANISGLTSLEILDLSNTRVTDAGLAHLAKLVNLKQLRLNSAQVTGPGLANLEDMTQLKWLWLGKSPLRDLSSIPPLPGLQWLILNESPVGDAELATLPRLPALKLINLQRTNVTNSGLREILRLKDSLTNLGLSGTKVTDAATPTLLEMTNLTGLLLDDTKITDATLDQLPAMKGLKTMDLSRSAVTEAGIARLRKALPNLKMTSELVAASNARSRAAATAASKRPGPQP